MVSWLIDHDRPKDEKGHLQIVHPEIVRYGDGDQGYWERDFWKYHPLSKDIHAFNVVHGLLYLTFQKDSKHHIIYFKITKNHSIIIHDFSSCFDLEKNGLHDQALRNVANYLLRRTWHGKLISSSDLSGNLVGLYELGHCYDHGTSNPQICGANAFLYLVENSPNHGTTMDSLCDWMKHGACDFDLTQHDEDYYTKMKCVRIVTNGIIRCNELVTLIAKPSQQQAWLQRRPYLEASYVVRWAYFSEPENQVTCICDQWAYKRNKVFLPCCGKHLHTNCFFRWYKDKEIFHKLRGCASHCFLCQQPMTTIHLLPDNEHQFTKKGGYFRSTRFPHVDDGGTLRISGELSGLGSQANIDHVLDSVRRMSPQEQVSMRRMILGVHILLMDYPRHEARRMLLGRCDDGYNIRKWHPSEQLPAFHYDLVPERNDLNFFISSDHTTFIGVDGVQCISRDEQDNESSFEVSDSITQFEGNDDNEIEYLGTVELKHWLPFSEKQLHKYAFELLEASTKWFTVYNYPHEIDRYTDKTYFQNRSKEVLIFRFGHFIFLTLEEDIADALHYLPLVCALPDFPKHELKCVKECKNSFPFSPEWVWHHHHGPGCCAANKVRLGYRVPIGSQIGFFLHKSVLRCFKNTSKVEGWTPQRLINPHAVPPIFGKTSTNQLRAENKWISNQEEDLFDCTIRDYYFKMHQASDMTTQNSLPRREEHFSGQFEFEELSFLFDFNHLPTGVKHGMTGMKFQAEDMVYLTDHSKPNSADKKRSQVRQKESLRNKKPARGCGPDLLEDKKPAAKRR